MGVVNVVLLILQVLLSLVMIMLILLHRGRGGGLSDMFGGGFSSSYAGSSTVQRYLNVATVWVAILWFFVVLALGFTVGS